MARPTGVFKRSPEMETEFQGRYAKISKADWADLYFDLYRQMNGESEPSSVIMQDAEKRLSVLKQYRES